MLSVIVSCLYVVDGFVYCLSTECNGSLAVLQVAGGEGALVGETEDTNEESVIVGGQ